MADRPMRLVLEQGAAGTEVSLDLARRGNVVTTPELAAASTDHVCDLLALALGPTHEAAEQVGCAASPRRGCARCKTMSAKPSIGRTCRSTTSPRGSQSSLRPVAS